MTGRDSTSLNSVTGRNVTVCGGGVIRKSVVYVSVGNRLEVGLERGGDLASYGIHYLIEYQGEKQVDLYNDMISTFPVSEITFLEFYMINFTSSPGDRYIYIHYGNKIHA